jgi:hypothetical protein
MVVFNEVVLSWIIPLDRIGPTAASIQINCAAGVA